jgi:hypothetical protein
MTKIDGRGRTHDWLTNLAKAVSNRPAQPAAEIRSAPRPALSSACAEGDEASRAAGLPELPDKPGVWFRDGRYVEVTEAGKRLWYRGFDGRCYLLTDNGECNLRDLPHGGWRLADGAGTP